MHISSQLTIGISERTRVGGAVLLEMIPVLMNWAVQFVLSARHGFGMFDKRLYSVPPLQIESSTVASLFVEGDPPIEQNKKKCSANIFGLAHLKLGL